MAIEIKTPIGDAFDKLSFHEVRQHLTAAIKNTNERNNPETRSVN